MATNTVLTQGAAAFQALIRTVGDKGEADLLSSDGSVDTRDYRAMAVLVAKDLDANLHHPDSMHREGYLRALTDLLSISADGFGIDQVWDPIKDTAAAFEVPAGS